MQAKKQASRRSSAAGNGRTSADSDDAAEDKLDLVQLKASLCCMKLVLETTGNQSVCGLIFSLSLQIAAMLDGRLAAIMDASMPSTDLDKKRKKEKKKRSKDGGGDGSGGDACDDPDHPSSRTPSGRREDEAADDSLSGLRFFKRVPKGALVKLGAHG